MTDIISQYYQGIVQQLRSEVDSINNLFRHQGVKGGGNEDALRELLKKFIPKRFGVGTGVVIDRDGNQSRQCDIVIYDAFYYPSLLSLTNVHFFPVDIVYATIEVKTTLTSDAMKKAKANIASVKQLNFITDQFTGSEARGDNFSIGAYTPTPPLGFIFAYNSNTQQFETFKKWVNPINANEEASLPSVVGCLDQGLILIYPKPEMLVKGWMFSLQDSQGNSIAFTDARENYTFNGHIYPVKKFANKYVVIDQSRALLLFLLLLQEMLSTKRINPNISFLKTYFRVVPTDGSYEI